MTFGRFLTPYFEYSVKPVDLIYILYFFLSVSYCIKKSTSFPYYIDVIIIYKKIILYD